VQVKVTIATKSAANEISWEIDCKHLPTNFRDTTGRLSDTHFYEDDKVYKEQLCLEPGQHSLKLMDAL
jgi:hypothetical protein